MYADAMPMAVNTSESIALVEEESGMAAFPSCIAETILLEDTLKVR